eukprot:TRINITY_DN65717_c0_g1_i1.p1 TRINITY_DN65717_c0_g1~~TRINITY_DN65717_c0_g1_i1.p1  ORF type:complete len:679 (-),score=91.11 TRINITY_DN65717_c0_g1_i1:35-2071(-)
MAVWPTLERAWWLCRLLRGYLLIVFVLTPAQATTQVAWADGSLVGRLSPSLARPGSLNDLKGSRLAFHVDASGDLKADNASWSLHRRAPVEEEAMQFYVRNVDYQTLAANSSLNATFLACISQVVAEAANVSNSSLLIALHEGGSVHTATLSAASVAVQITLQGDGAWGAEEVSKSRTLSARLRAKLDDALGRLKEVDQFVHNAGDSVTVSSIDFGKLRTVEAPWRGRPMEAKPMELPPMVSSAPPGTTAAPIRSRPGYPYGYHRPPASGTEPAAGTSGRYKDRMATAGPTAAPPLHAFPSHAHDTGGVSGTKVTILPCGGGRSGSSSGFIAGFFDFVFGLISFPFQVAWHILTFPVHVLSGTATADPQQSPAAAGEEAARAILQAGGSMHDAMIAAHDAAATVARASGATPAEVEREATAASDAVMEAEEKRKKKSAQHSSDSAGEAEVSAFSPIAGQLVALGQHVLDFFLWFARSVNYLLQAVLWCLYCICRGIAVIVGAILGFVVYLLRTMAAMLVAVGEAALELLHVYVPNASTAASSQKNLEIVSTTFPVTWAASSSQIPSTTKESSPSWVRREPEAAGSGDATQRRRSVSVATAAPSTTAEASARRRRSLPVDVADDSADYVPMEPTEYATEESQPEFATFVAICLVFSPIVVLCAMLWYAEVKDREIPVQI